MTQVYVAPIGNYAGKYFYAVFVDGEKYDEFTSKGWITQSEMYDVARGYQEYFDSLDKA